MVRSSVSVEASNAVFGVRCICVHMRRGALPYLAFLSLTLLVQAVGNRNFTEISYSNMQEGRVGPVC